jgi:hypothetical protein
MFAGFQLSSTKDLTAYKTIGEGLYNKYKGEIELRLDKYINKNGNLDGKAMQDDWFPEFEANIFISHSHSNLDEIQALAGWLHKEMGLLAFIDSSVWGYSDKLLKAIDDEYCKHENGESYSYEKRNYSTSHVHMMLSTALTKMIDKTECVFFLNTPESISASDVVKTQTKSPWIYHEIVMTDLIRKKSIGEHRKQVIQEQYTLEKSAKALHIDHDITHPLSKLEELNDTDLGAWQLLYNTHKQQYGNEVFSLDSLYKLKIPNAIK